MLSYRKSTGLSSLRHAELYLLEIHHIKRGCSHSVATSKKTLLPSGRDVEKKRCSHSVATSKKNVAPIRSRRRLPQRFFETFATSRHSSNKFGSALGKNVAPIRSRRRLPQRFFETFATSRHSSNKFGSALGKNVAPIRSRRRKKTLLPSGRDVDFRNGIESLPLRGN
jgi:hypothetical protein